ncbi:MAG: rhamnulokinase [Lachnospiraceae bacterium]|nr:rhamnulokinase [Lachnospiraceae bacterium]
MEIKEYYLAVDIGASSGRHILGSVKDGRIITEEIYRFENKMLEEDGHKVWDLKYLFKEILNGLKKCKEIGRIPGAMGIDTWAVDYVLLDEADRVMGKTYAYRDERTKDMPTELYKTVPEDKLYDITGIQKASFNTIFQLLAHKRQEPDILKNARSFLMLPDYFNFLLTGKKNQEYTNATSTGLVNAKDKCWDKELIKALDFPTELFSELTLPGKDIGNLKEEIKAEIGFDTKVYAVASHDTGSAVMSVPSLEENTLYISSGTWSLLGCERLKPDCSKKARLSNFTNEGGYDYRFRFLKNIMGLWMIQSVRNELAKKGEEYSFARLCDMAKGGKVDIIIDVSDQRFLAPASMIEEVCKAVREIDKDVLLSTADIARVIYRSLADCYAKSIQQLETITDRKYKSLYVVGGGSNAEYLNSLTAEATGLRVYAGPSEATAIGNLGAQFIAGSVFASLEEFRRAVMRSFDIKEYTGRQV